MIETLLMVALSGEVLCAVAGRRVLECYREVSHRIGERVFIQKSSDCSHAVGHCVPLLATGYIFVSPRHGEEF